MNDKIDAIVEAERLVSQVANPNDELYGFFRQTVNAWLRCATSEAIASYLIRGKNEFLREKVKDLLVNRALPIDPDDDGSRKIIGWLLEGFVGENTRVKMSKRALFVKVLWLATNEELQKALDFLVSSDGINDFSYRIKVAEALLPESLEIVKKCFPDYRAMRIVAQYDPQYVSDHIGDLISAYPRDLYNQKLEVVRLVSSRIDLIALPCFAEHFVDCVFLAAKVGQAVPEECFRKYLPQDLDPDQIGVVIWALGEFGYMSLLQDFTRKHGVAASA